MKILSKVKSVIIGIGIGILTFANKVFAISPMNMIEMDTVALYGVAKPNPVRVIFKIAKVFVIPVALIVGLLIYFKKSKSSKKKKAIVTLITLIIVAIIYVILNNIYYLI